MSSPSKPSQKSQPVNQTKKPLTLSEDIMSLSSFKLLSEVLRERDVKRAIFQTMHEEGVPGWLCSLVYRLIVVAASGGETFLGVAIQSRLKAFIDVHPKLARVFQRLQNVQKGAATKDALRERTLQACLQDQPLNQALKVDDSTSLEVLLALHNQQALDRIIANQSDQNCTILSTISSQLDTLFQNIMEPALSWSDEALQGANLSAMDMIRYNSGLHTFVGRDAELDMLAHFTGSLDLAGKKHNFKWTMITGQGGEGKTRLAYTFTREHLDKIWHMGALSHAAMEAWHGIEKWRPRAPTFIVVDYVRARTAKIRDTLLALAANACNFDFPVRILLLERDSSEQLESEILGGSAASSIAKQHMFDPTGEGRVGVPLPPIQKDAIIDLMQEHLFKSGLPPQDRELLFAAATAVDRRAHNGQAYPRALFALAVAEEIRAKFTKNPKFDLSDFGKTLTKEGVLGDILKRDELERWRPVSKEASFDLHKNLLTLATICNGLDLDILPNAPLPSELRQWLPDPPPRGDHPQIQALLEAMGMVGRYLPNMEPDILGEFFVLNTLKAISAPANAQLIAAAFDISGHQSAEFSLRFMMDLDIENGNPFLAEICPTTLAGAEKYGAFLYSLVGIKGSIRDWVRVDDAFRRMDALRNAFPKDQEIAVQEAKAATNLTSVAGQAQDWERVDDAFRRMDALRNAFPKDQEIAVLEAKAATNLTGVAGEAQDWVRVDDAFRRMDALRNAFPKDQEIGVAEAEAATNLANAAGEAQDWARVDDAFQRMNALRNAFPKDQEIAVAEAEAATNLTSVAGQAQDWERIDDAFRRMDALRNAFPKDQEIAVQEAKAATNLANAAGEAQDWARVDDAFRRIDALRKAFPKDQEIAVAEAEAAFNHFVDARKAQDWARVDDAFRRIDALRKAFPKDQEIAVLEAKAATNLTSVAGQAQDWVRVDDAFRRMDALRNAFPKDQEIAVLEAKAATNLTSVAGEAQDWVRVDDAFRRMDALRNAFPKDQEIAVQEAKAATNLTSVAGQAQDWERIDEAFRRLHCVVKTFPANIEISSIAISPSIRALVAALQEELPTKVFNSARSLMDDIFSAQPDFLKAGLELAEGHPISLKDFLEIVDEERGK